MKNSIKPLAMVFLIASSFCACHSGSQDNNNGKDSAQAQNKTTFQDNKDDKNNAQFVVDVAGANYYEIGLSKYAAATSTNSQVKDFAQMMVTDHSGALDKLKAVAAKQNIALPPDDTAKVNDKIKSWQGKNPNDFNKAYVDEMVSEHKGAADKLGKGDSTITNADIKGWIDATLPTVKEHLQKITDLQKGMK